MLAHMIWKARTDAYMRILKYYILSKVLYIKWRRCGRGGETGSKEFEPQPAGDE